MKTDLQLQQDIEHALRADPRVKDHRIGITVTQGAVALFGAVGTYPEKWAAEEAAQRVDGVTTVVQELTVVLASHHQRTDTELAVAVDHALSWDVFVPSSVTATVQAGAVSLTGAAEWSFERDAASQAIRQLTGVVNISNFIELTPKAPAGGLALPGHATTQEGIDQTRAAAWSAPFVTSVVAPQ